METEADWEKEFKFLDDLRDSGEVNMYGAVPYLMEEFGMGMGMGIQIHKHWMLRKTRQGRDEVIG